MARHTQPSYDQPLQLKSRELTAHPTVIGCFLAMFPENAIQLMVNMTNANYQKKNRIRESKRMERMRGASSRKRSHERKWTDITIEEMKAYIGFTIAMGVLKLPRLILYWKTSHIFATPGFGSVMSSDRYRHSQASIFQQSE